MRSFSQSGSSSASSDVSTRKAVGRGFFSGNQMSSRAWNSSSPAAGGTQGQPGAPCTEARGGSGRESLDSGGSWSQLRGLVLHETVFLLGREEGWEHRKAPGPCPRASHNHRPVWPGSEESACPSVVRPCGCCCVLSQKPLDRQGEGSPTHPLQDRRSRPPAPPQVLTAGRPQCQQDDHGVHHQDVHGGRLPAAPAQEDLVLRLRLQGEGGEGRQAPGRRAPGGWLPALPSCTPPPPPCSCACAGRSGRRWRAARPARRPTRRCRSAWRRGGP